jgi:hypothetical protein
MITLVNGINTKSMFRPFFSMRRPVVTGPEKSVKDEHGFPLSEFIEVQLH